MNPSHSSASSGSSGSSVTSGSPTPSRARTASVLLLAAGFLAGSVGAAPAAAQACFGGAPVPGQFTVGGYGSFADAGKAYGVSSEANLQGPAFMGARIGVIDLDDADDNLTSVGGHLGFDLVQRGALSLCPIVGVDYDFWSGTFLGAELDVSRVAVPVALGVGARLGEGNGMAIIPSGRVGLLHQRFSGGASAGPLVFQRDDTANDAFFDGGVTLALGRVYARGGVFRIFEDNAETTFRVSAGFVF